jgi:archaellum component FlaC
MNLFKRAIEVFANLNDEFEASKDTKVEETFEQVVDTEGTEFNISSREVGASVTFEDAPMKDGTYTLTDNFSFKVKDGLIESIEAEVEKVEEVSPVDEALAEDAVEVVGEPAKNEELDALKAEVESLKSELESIKESLKGLSTKEDVQAFSSEIQTLGNNIKTLASIPLEQSKTNNGFKSLNSKLKDHETLSQVFQNIK